VFDGVETTPFDPAMIARLEQDLSPSVYTVAARADAAAVAERGADERPAEETAPFVPLASKLRPISTPAMSGRTCGEALAGCSRTRRHPGRARGRPAGTRVGRVRGGGAGIFEPVFLFDNWPHPQGVVPSHLVLAAALHYQPLFLKARAARG
jgi:hypothetical protein